MTLSENDDNKREIRNRNLEDKIFTKIDQRLIKYANNKIKLLFIDERGDSYAQIYEDDHYEVHKIESRKFSMWLRKDFYLNENTSIKKESVQNVVEHFSAHALFQKPIKKITLQNRVAKINDKIYYDLTNDKHESILITPDGFSIVQKSPLFRRHPHQKRQVYPKDGGSIDSLWDLLNISKKNDMLLLIGWLCTAFIPNISHQILVFTGSEGCGKSFGMKILRMLLDPSEIPLLTVSQKKDDIHVLLHQHYIVFLDNIHKISDWLTDVLCKASTGEGFTKRKLYTDEDAVIFQYNRCIGINGINIVPERPELMDRSLIIQLDQISIHSRRSEAVMLSEFKEKLPHILGAIFAAVSNGMKIFPSLNLDRLPRMADATLWGEAIARGLGYPDYAYLNAYFDKINEQSLIVLEANPLGTAILKLLEKKSEWNGTPQELLCKLNTIAKKYQLDTNSAGWPRVAQWVTRRLNELEAILYKSDVKFTSKRVNGIREINLIKFDNKSSKTLISSISTNDTLDFLPKK